MRDPGPDIHSQVPQVAGDLGRCPELAIAEFWVLVYIAAPLDDPGLHIGGPPVDLFSKRTAQVLCCRGWGRRRNSQAKEQHEADPDEPTRGVLERRGKHKASFIRALLHGSGRGWNSPFSKP